MVDLLEQGGDDDEPRKLLPRGRISVIAMWAGGLALVVAAVLPVFGPPDTKAGRPASPATPGAPPMNSGDVGIPTPGAARAVLPAERFTTGEHVLLLTADAVVRLDLRESRIQRLPLPIRGSRAVQGGLLAGPDADVVVLAGPRDGAAYTVTPGAATARALGRASVAVAGSRVVAGSGVSTWWLDRDLHGPRREVTEVDGRGARGTTMLVEDGQRVFGETTAGVVVGSRVQSGDSPVQVEDPTGAAPGRRLARRGVVLDVLGDAVLWARCPYCPPLLTRIAPTGALTTRPLELANFRFGGQAALAPDGRHVALLVRGPDAARRTAWDVAIGHLPHDERSGVLRSAVGGRLRPEYRDAPMIGWLPSNRLLVSDGHTILVADRSGAPPGVLAIDVPEHNDLAAG